MVRPYTPLQPQQLYFRPPPIKTFEILAFLVEVSETVMKLFGPKMTTWLLLLLLAASGCYWLLIGCSWLLLWSIKASRHCIEVREASWYSIEASWYSTQAAWHYTKALHRSFFRFHESFLVSSYSINLFGPLCWARKSFNTRCVRAPLMISGGSTHQLEHLKTSCQTSHASLVDLASLHTSSRLVARCEFMGRTTGPPSFTFKF